MKKRAPGILEYVVKRLISPLLAVLFSLVLFTRAGAQSPESIWLSASTTAYKTGETVIVMVNASSATPVQGFTFQIRYDPACLRPVNASSPIPGMNGLQLPQVSGLVDGSYASTTPQTVNGALAEVRFTALQGCQTGVYLESAALAVRTAEGFAAPLASVLVGERNVSLTLDNEQGVAQPVQESGSVLSLEPPPAESGFPFWLVGIGVGVLVVLGMFGIFKALSGGRAR
ncbi:MAG: cohesin domain-containing protein [Anaerolineales bacterium]